MKKKLRFTYCGIFIILLVSEVVIALFVNDRFIRPYVGDILVIGVICAFFRMFVPDRIRTLPLLTSAFAAGVELLQYFDFVSLLGLAENPVLSVALGRTFDFKDIICYIVGGILFYSAENSIRNGDESNEI